MKEYKVINPSFYALESDLSIAAEDGWRVIAASSPIVMAGYMTPDFHFVLEREAPAEAVMARLGLCNCCDRSPIPVNWSHAKDCPARKDGG